MRDEAMDFIQTCDRELKVVNYHIGRKIFHWVGKILSSKNYYVVYTYFTIQENVEFLMEAAQCFHSRGHSEDACSLCYCACMDHSAAQGSPQLQAMELEILGSMKQLDRIWDLIDTVRDLFNILMYYLAVSTHKHLFNVCHIVTSIDGVIANFSWNAMPPNT